MSAPDHNRFADETAAYLLGALEPHERAAFEQHLAGCPECRREVEELRVASDALPRSVEQVEPPPALKASLMETVRADARAAAGQGAPSRSRRSGWRGLLLARPGFAAAAAALLVVLGIGAGVLVGALGGGGDDREVVAAQIDRERMPAGAGELVVDENGSAVLQVSGMQQPPADHVYEVWLERDGRVERSSLFTVTRDGSGTAAIPEGVEGVDRVMVTREPDGGSDQPSERPVMSVEL